MKRAMWLWAVLALAGCEVEDLGGGGSDYSAVFDDAGGLVPGGRVYVAGVRVGRIQSVALEGDKARVGISLDRDAPPVNSDACLRIGWYGVGNGAHIALDPGKAGPLEPGATIACTRSGNDLSATTERAAENASKLLDEAVSGKGVVAMLLRDEAFAAKVAAFFEAPPAPPAPKAEDEGGDGGKGGDGDKGGDGEGAAPRKPAQGKAAEKSSAKKDGKLINPF